MTEEIKELLDTPIFMIDNDGFTVYINDKINNYITNLQKENEKLKSQLGFIDEQNKYIDKLENGITNLQKENLALARENEQEKQFIKDCGFENTQQLALEYISLREEKENFRKLKERYQLEKEIYKQRNEKASAFLKHLKNTFDESDEMYNLLNNAIDILKGGDEE